MLASWVLTNLSGERVRDATKDLLPLGEERDVLSRDTLTRNTVNGGYAGYSQVRTDFSCPLPAGLDNLHVAPLICAGTPQGAVSS